MMFLHSTASSSTEGSTTSLHPSQETMSLLVLPQELLSEIAFQCRSSDIPKLRLTCKPLYHAATDHFLKEVKLYLTKESMSMAETIGTHHPVLAENIQSCWFQADRVPFFGSFAQWRGEVFRGFESFRSLLSGDLREEDTLESRYQRYVRLADEQRDLCSNDAISHTLYTLFHACPNLKALWLTLGGLGRKLTTYRHKPYLDAACIPTQDPLRTRNRGGVVAFQQAILAAAKANLSLHTLVLAGLGHMALNEVGLDHRVIAAVAKVLRTVRNLHLQVRSPEELSGEPNSSNMGPTFRQWFRNHHIDLTSLRHLHLELPPLQSFRSSNVDFEDLIADLTFPHLRRLTLTQVQADLTKLSSFLFAHGATLQRVKLANLIGMGVMTWQALFESIAGKLSALEVIELRGSFTHHLQRWSEGYWHLSYSVRSDCGTPFAEALSDDIVRGGPRFPVQEEQGHLRPDAGKLLSMCDMLRIDQDEGEDS